MFHSVKDPLRLINFEHLPHKNAQTIWDDLQIKPSYVNGLIIFIFGHETKHRMQLAVAKIMIRLW